MPVIVMVFGLMFFVCAARSGAAEPGRLTITGIPSEFEGKYFTSIMFSIPDYSKAISGSKRIAEGMSTVVVNGEAKLPVYEYKLVGKPKVYNASNVLDVKFMIHDSSDISGKEFYSPNVVFAAVQFSNGIAEVTWGDAIKAGIITITNIPDLYNSGFQTLQLVIGQTSYNIINPETPSGYGVIKNGRISVPVLRARDRSGYVPYTENGTKDILLIIQPPKSGQAISVYDQYLFTNVRITNGRADINFAVGSKQ